MNSFKNLIENLIEEKKFNEINKIILELDYIELLNYDYFEDNKNLLQISIDNKELKLTKNILKKYKDYIIQNNIPHFYNIENFEKNSYSKYYDDYLYLIEMYKNFSFKDFKDIYEIYKNDFIYENCNFLHYLSKNLSIYQETQTTELAINKKLAKNNVELFLSSPKEDIKQNYLNSIIVNLFLDQYLDDKLDLFKKMFYHLTNDEDFKFKNKEFYIDSNLKLFLYLIEETIPLEKIDFFISKLDFNISAHKNKKNNGIEITLLELKLKFKNIENNNKNISILKHILNKFDLNEKFNSIYISEYKDNLISLKDLVKIYEEKIGISILENKEIKINKNKSYL